MSARLDCARCGTPLGLGRYSGRLLSATEQLLHVAPDGGSLHATLAAESACSWNCLAVLAAQRAGADADAAVLAVAERERQVVAEDWSPEHDDAHVRGQMAEAGACYAVNAGRERVELAPPAEWPWDTEWWKPKDELRDLVRAAALIAAEGDRIVRQRRRDQQDRF